MINSIRARITIAFSLSMALIILLTCLMLILAVRHTAEESVARRLQVAVDEVQRELVATDEPVSREALLKEGRDLFAENLHLMVISPSGKTLVQSHNNTPQPPLNSLENQTRWRIRTLPWGENTIVIALLWDKTEQELQREAVALLFFGAITSGVTAVGAWMIVGRTLLPIQHLARQVQVAAVPQVFLTPSSQDREIVELVGTLNGLLARISSAADARGRFYAAASHELRTPIQALSGHLELALLRPRDAAHYQETIREAYVQTQRLIALMQSLLLLNRLENAPAPMGKLEYSELDAICRRLIAFYEPLAKDRNLTVEADLQANTALSGIPQHGEIIVRNVIENAVRYATPHTTISITLAQTLEAPKFTIFNICPPFTSRDESRLFEPFARPDASRSAHTGGNGLGLAICKAIADANGWKIDIHQESGGVCCVIHFRAIPENAMPSA
jgi:signal transduction histidine kinase